MWHNLDMSVIEFSDFSSGLLGLYMYVKEVCRHIIE